MANEQAKNDASPPKKRFSKKTLGIVLGAAIFQGVAFFVIFKVAGGSPEPAHGEGSHAIEAEQTVSEAEVVLLRGFRVPNDKSGRMWIYDIDISIVVTSDKQAKMEKLAESHAGEISDRVARILRAATPQMLGEDDLRVLRDQLAEGLNEITGGEGLIQRILIPRLVPIPS